MKQTPSFSFPAGPVQDQVVSTHDDFTLEVCLQEESKRLAFRIRYRAYLQAGMIQENDEQLFYDDFDYAPNARVFLVWHQEKPVATIRSCVYTAAFDWLPTEGVRYFKEELRDAIGAQTPLLESNRFAVDPDFQGRQSIFAQFLLFRAHGLNAGAHGCDYIITSVQANHVAFYQRFLSLNPISDQARRYDWFDKDVTLLINRTELCLGTIVKKGMPPYDQQDIQAFAELAGISPADYRRKVA